MLGKISSQQLLAAIHQLQNGNMSEHEEDELIAKLEASISDPNLSDYIFYSSLSPAEIVARAAAHRPIVVSDNG